MCKCGELETLSVAFTKNTQLASRVEGLLSNRLIRFCLVTKDIESISLENKGIIYQDIV